MALRALKAVAVVVVLVYVGRTLIRTWGDFSGQSFAFEPQWGHVALASLIVLGAYGVLIETWRAMLRTWGDRLDTFTAARIWFVSSLSRNLPGKIWQIGAMALMARKAQVSPAAAAGSAVLNTVVNIGCGLGIAVGFGRDHLDKLSGGYGEIGVVLLVALVIGIVVLPIYLPRLIAIAERLTGRQFGLTSLSPSAVVFSVVGNVVAWMLYGVAFRLFVAGVTGSAPGPVLAYVVVWAASYVVGYLFLFVPAGLGVREGVLVVALQSFGLANPQQAIVISLSSRLWLTILEILPGLVFLALRPRWRTNESSPSIDPDADPAAGDPAAR